METRQGGGKLTVTCGRATCLTDHIVHVLSLSVCVDQGQSCSQGKFFRPRLGLLRVPILRQASFWGGAGRLVGTTLLVDLLLPSCEFGRTNWA
eukprot:139158-Prorocentrum_minimum.AAC.2